MATDLSQKIPVFFCCEHCDYTTCSKKDFTKHESTLKHKNLQKSTNSNEKSQKIPNILSCKCGKIYKERSGLWRHRKQCDGNKYIEKENDTTDKDLILMLIKENSELKNMVLDVCQKIQPLNNTVNSHNVNSNNKTFNLNVFLNEKCKDALNINDFIESLKITLEDLDFSNKNGMVQGISNLMIKGLKELDIHKRPIHCTDAKRDIIYIKDKEKWEKDDNHSKIKNTIVKVANKERNSLYLWVDKNPHWFDSEATQIEYLTMMRNICEPVEDFEKNEKKIIKNIGREVTLDKCAM